MRKLGQVLIHVTELAGSQASKLETMIAQFRGVLSEIVCLDVCMETPRAEKGLATD